MIRMVIIKFLYFWSLKGVYMIFGAKIIHNEGIALSYAVVVVEKPFPRLPITKLFCPDTRTGSQIVEGSGVLTLSILFKN